MPSPELCECTGPANVFSAKDAEDDLRSYRREGPHPTTRALLDAILAEGVEGLTILDVGAGIGAIQLELLAAGAASAQSVDASAPYVAAARAEAERRGLRDRTVVRHGDFVALASDIEAADVVTLDHVVCCYGDMPALVGRSVEHARRMVGLIYPRQAWWTRAVALCMDFGSRLTRSSLRWHLHPPTAIDELIRTGGFERRFFRRGWFWEIALYVRKSAAPSA
jgi:magnesium-protoporphyrin O-methyltransferase